MVDSLRHDCLIRLEAIQEEDREYYALFEWVPQSLEQWSSGVSR